MRRNRTLPSVLGFLLLLSGRSRDGALLRLKDGASELHACWYGNMVHLKLLFGNSNADAPRLV